MPTKRTPEPKVRILFTEDSSVELRALRGLIELAEQRRARRRAMKVQQIDFSLGKSKPEAA